MARDVLFVQGAGEGVHAAWDVKLVKSLERNLGAGYRVRYPAMPNEADPNYADWKAALLQAFDDLQDDAVLVGHSAGGAILMQLLADEASRYRPRAVFLIATPFLGDGGWPSHEMDDTTAIARRMPAGMPIFLYHGDADEEVPPGHLELYARAFPHATIRALPGRDHQVNNDLSEVARDIRYGF